MPKFKFKSARKNKFNFFKDKEEILGNEIIGVHTEMFSNRKIVIEGCKSIVEYQENYIKLKFKKGFFNIFGADFLITDFDDEKIVIKGKITSIEFCF